MLHNERKFSSAHPRRPDWKVRRLLPNREEHPLPTFDAGRPPTARARCCGASMPEGSFFRRVRSLLDLGFEIPTQCKKCLVVADVVELYSLRMAANTTSINVKYVGVSLDDLPIRRGSTPADPQRGQVPSLLLQSRIAQNEPKSELNEPLSSLQGTSPSNKRYGALVHTNCFFVSPRRHFCGSLPMRPFFNASTFSILQHVCYSFLGLMNGSIRSRQRSPRCRFGRFWDGCRNFLVVAAELFSVACFA